MKVLLFDIDGTLINTGGAGAAALRMAFARQFGITEPRDVIYSGRTDRAISRDMLELHALEHSLENWTRLRDEYLLQLPTFLPQCSGRVLPGVDVLISHLTACDDVRMGLLTGNVREGARLKLEHYDLFKHFAFGGFGDDHFDRNHVAEAAMASARQHLNGDFEEDSVWVIGDTPLDIRCARWIGARCLAVATGVHPRQELAELAPDLLLDDLSKLDHILAAFNGETACQQ